MGTILKSTLVKYDRDIYVLEGNRTMKPLSTDHSNYTRKTADVEKFSKKSTDANRDCHRLITNDLFVNQNIRLDFL